MIKINVANTNVPFGNMMRNTTQKSVTKSNINTEINVGKIKGPIATWWARY